ncbi:IS1 family transposase [Enterobacter asburiae]|nr:IS1 family transposase [Enterobacter asburiae]
MFMVRIFLKRFSSLLTIKRLACRTICFSRSVELHEKVIGAFIETYMFY